MLSRLFILEGGHLQLPSEELGGAPAVKDVRHRDEERARGLVEEGGKSLGQRGVVGVKEEGEVRQD